MGPLPSGYKFSEYARYQWETYVPLPEPKKTKKFIDFSATLSPQGLTSHERRVG